MLNIIGVSFSLIGLACAIFIWVHAFQRSVGTGFMVLCIPCYNFYYAFSQFEHRWKGWIIAGLFIGLPMGAVLLAVGSPVAALQ